MRLVKPYALILIMISLGFAQVKLAQESKGSKTASRPSLEQDMDKTVSPCMSSYPYACGKWMKDNPIPPDQSRWGQFNELTERNREILRGILEKAAKAGAQRSALGQKYGDFYRDCMDEKTVEAKAATPLKPELDRIAAIKSREDLIAEIAHLQGKGVGALFTFGPSPNLHDARQMIANVDQRGLSLPDRDYYIKDDPKTKETRQKFVEHVQKIFALLGDPPEAGALKTLREFHRSPARRSRGTSLCGRNVWTRGQGARAKDGRGAGESSGKRHPHAGLDDSRHQREGRGQATRHHQQDRLPR